MIYSSGRESYFNLNSTWYDPSGSWLDTRRTPFRYGYANCCSSGCDGEGVEGMRGHDYRHYGYRQPVCSERCQGYGSSECCHGGSACVRRPTYSYGSSGGCQGYGRSVCSERCQGSAGGCQGYGRSVCSERCQGSSGSCHGGGSSCVRRPTYSSGSAGGCQGYGRSVCSETCHGSGYQGGKVSYGKASQCIPQCVPQSSPKCIPQSSQKCAPKCIPQSAPKCAPKCVPVQTCPPPVQVCPPPVQVCPPPVQVCPPPVQVCPPPVQVCPPQIQQGCVPVPKGIPRQQQKQVCKIPARKIK